MVRFSAESVRPLDIVTGDAWIPAIWVRSSAAATRRGLMEFLRELRKGGNRSLVGVAMVAAIGGFLFGYDTGIVGGALLLLVKDLKPSTFDQQAIVGSLLVGAVVGAIAAGYLADAISRRRTKIIAGSIFVVGAIGAGLSQTVWELLISRFALGLAVGTASFVAPMYIAELVPKRVRGGMVSFNQLMITVGILGAYIASWGLKGVSNNWRWMFALGAIPGAALAIGMWRMPFSPRWLVEQGREDEAREVLHLYRKDEDVDEEIEEIKTVSQEERSLRDLLAPAVRPMLIVGLGLAIFQQVVGINTVIYYAPTILSFTGLNAKSAITQALFIGLTNVIFTIVAVLLLDKLGRRVFLLVGTACVLVSLVALGFYFHSPYLQDHAPHMALAALLLYIAGFAIGLGPVFWLMISEIFPLAVRGPAMSVCTVANWAFNFGVSFTFLTLVSALGRDGAFWLYAGIAVLAIVFFWARVPETKGRTLEDIERDLGADAGDGKRKAEPAGQQA
jgi:sugar porter (SP) family MFS transporter